MRALVGLIALFWLVSSSFAKQNSTIRLESYLSKLKQKQFEYDLRKNEADALKLRDSWIAPLQLSYRYSKSNPYGNEQVSKNSSIAWNQSIFRSGGIFYGIKFANASREYGNYSIAMQKRKVIKDAISLLMQLKKIDLQIQKQKKQIANSTIKLEQNKEQYLSGELDSGFLDNAVITLNLTKQALLDLKAQKQKLIASFKALSDIDYKTAYIPHLKEISKEQFLAHNIALKLYESQANRDSYNTNVIMAKYLPNVAFNVSYNRDELENPTFAGTGVPSPPPTNYYRYGFSVTMPLDFNTLRDIESAKLGYLKSSIIIEDKKRELIALYEQVEQNIKAIEQKIALAKENYTIYKKLLDDTKDLFQAGEKTQMDVELLQNSTDMALLDQKIFEIDKQLELLSLYEYYQKD